jgi:hypothetical protein
MNLNILVHATAQGMAIIHSFVTGDIGRVPYTNQFSSKASVTTSTCNKVQVDKRNRRASRISSF